MGALWRLQQWEKRLWTQIWLTGKRFVWKAQIRKTEGGQKGQQETHEHRGNVEAHTHQGTAPFSPFKFYLLFLFFWISFVGHFFYKISYFFVRTLSKIFFMKSVFFPSLPPFLLPPIPINTLSVLSLFNEGYTALSFSFKLHFTL